MFAQGLITKAVILDLARGRSQEADALLRCALDVALAHDRSEAALRAYNNLGSSAGNDDRYREALERSRAYAEFGRRIGDRVSGIRELAFRVVMLAALGEWDEALGLADEVEQEAPGSDAAVWTGHAVALMLARRGQLAEARRMLARARKGVDPHDVQDTALDRATEALVLLAEGHHREALSAAHDGLRVRSDLGLRHGAVKGALDAGLTAAFELHDESAVDELLAIIEATPPGRSTPYLRAIGARFGARRAALHGDGPAADAGFSAAAGILRKIELPFELAVVLVEHAEWLVGEGRSEEAEPLAAEAREIFERLRVKPYLERVDRMPTGTAAVL